MVLLAATKGSLVGWCVGLVAALIMASARPPGGGAEPTVLAEHVLSDGRKARISVLRVEVDALGSVDGLFFDSAVVPEGDLVVEPAAAEVVTLSVAGPQGGRPIPVHQFVVLRWSSHPHEAQIPTFVVEEFTWMAGSFFLVTRQDRGAVVVYEIRPHQFMVSTRVERPVRGVVTDPPAVLERPRWGVEMNEESGRVELVGRGRSADGAETVERFPLSRMVQP